MNRNENHFDFLRLLAACLVLLSHSYALKGFKETSDPIGQLTHSYFPSSFFGVQFFFLISGYLILSSWERSPSWYSYFWKRSLRIFPGLGILLLFMVFVYGPVFTELPLPIYFSKHTELLLFFRNLSLFKLHGALPGVFHQIPFPKELVGSLWTLPYEFTCYALLALWGSMGLLQYRMLTLILYVTLTILNFFPHYLNGFTLPILGFPLLPTIQFASYFLGGMVYKQWADSLPRSSVYYGAALILVAIFLYVNKPIGMYITGYFLIPFLLFGFVTVRSPLNDVGRWGDFSYGLYIYGFPVQQACIYLSNNTLSFAELFFLSLGSTLPLAYFSWHLVEAPALKLKNLID